MNNREEGAQALVWLCPTALSEKAGEGTIEHPYPAAPTNGSHSSKDDILSNSISITCHENFEWTNNNHLINQGLFSGKTELRSNQGWTLCSITDLVSAISCLGEGL